MIHRLRHRLACEESGFTLVELLIVLEIVGIVMLLAVPSYLSFEDRANRSAALSAVSQLVPNLESFSADNTGTSGDVDGSAATRGYAGMTLSLLQSKYDPSLKVGAGERVWVASSDAGFPAGVKMPAGLPSATSYCAIAKVGPWYAYRLGPTAALTTTKTAASVCT